MGAPLGPRSGVLRGPAPHPCGGRGPQTAAMQDLLSSSYWVRLGRLRFRVENKAIPGGEAEGPEGDSRQEVSTHSPPQRPRGGGGRTEGWGSGSPVLFGVGGGGSSQDSAVSTLTRAGLRSQGDPLEPSTPGESAGGPSPQLAPLLKLLWGHQEAVIVSFLL